MLSLGLRLRLGVRVEVGDDVISVKVISASFFYFCGRVGVKSLS